MAGGRATRPEATRYAAMLIAALAVAAVASAASCSLIPVRTTGTYDPATLADPDSRFIIVSGLSLHYKLYSYSGPRDGDVEVKTGVERTRPLIVLLHGFGASAFSWREVAVPLSAHGDVAAFDRPAFGLSDRPLSWDGPNPYSMESQVALTLGLIDALGAETAVLVGHSAGGTVAMNAALAAPRRVSALLLVSPAVYGTGAPRWLRPLLFFPPINRLGPLLSRRLASGGDDFIRSAWHDPSRLSAETLEGYRKPLLVKNWERALWEFTKASEDTGLEARLGGITSPVLVITGDDDRIVPAERSVRLAGELPSASILVIPECGHLAHEEAPNAFLSAASAFLDSLPRKH